MPKDNILNRDDQRPSRPFSRTIPLRLWVYLQPNDAQWRNLRKKKWKKSVLHANLARKLTLNIWKCSFWSGVQFMELFPLPWSRLMVPWKSWPYSRCSPETVCYYPIFYYFDLLWWSFWPHVTFLIFRSLKERCIQFYPRNNPEIRVEEWIGIAAREIVS